MTMVLFAAASVSVLISALIVWSLASKAIEFLTTVDLGRLRTIGWFPRRNMFDVSTLLVGSLMVTSVAMVVAVPVGLGAAIYLSEYAPRGVRRVVKPMLEVLSGIPSVVIGLFVVTWITPQIVNRLFADSGVFSVLAAGLGVGILTIPLVASVSEDALRAVPSVLREASYGVGARKMTTVVRIVIPAAISGLVASFILAASRAIGETMVVAIAAGGSGGALFNKDIREPGQTMTGAMTSLARGTDQVAGTGPAYLSLFFVGALLFVITLVLNIVANRVVERVRLRY
jgi:phosphate transport system permease protein